MSWNRSLLVLLVLAGLAPSAQAGLFGRKSSPPDPAVRVPALILTLKTDPDEGKRSAAAEELKQYDAKTFPEMTTALADAVLHDASAGVRSEAASTLGKLRPINRAAGYALEQAQDKDSSVRVRSAARLALWQYHLVGYRSGKAPEKPADPTPDPAAAQLPAANRLPQAPTATAKAAPPRPAAGPRGQSQEPPLASSSAPARPAPTAPRPPEAVPPTLQPVSAPKLLTPPPSAPPKADDAPAPLPGVGSVPARMPAGGPPPESPKPAETPAPAGNGDDGPSLSPPG